MRGARLAALVAFPVALAHELSHYLAALPWADESAILLEPAGGRATTLITWRADAPRWAVALACLFPTVLGAGLGVAALVWWGLAGLAVPADLEGWMRLTIGALSWGVFTWPSPSDLAAAREGPDDAVADPDGEVPT
jgi:hypothetical protein